MFGNSFYQQPYFQQQNFYLQESYQGFQQVDQPFQAKNQNFLDGQFQQGFQQPFHQVQQQNNQFQHQNQAFQPLNNQPQNFQQPYNNFQPSFHHSQPQHSNFQQPQLQPSNQNFQGFSSNFQQLYGGFQQPFNQGFQGENFQQPSSNFQASFQDQNAPFQSQNQCQPLFSQSGQICHKFQQPTYFEDSNLNQENYGSSSELIQQQRLEEMMQQLLLQQQSQQRAATTLQNLERQLGQLVSSMNQIQAQESSQLPSQESSDPEEKFDGIILKSGEPTSNQSIQKSNIHEEIPSDQFSDQINLEMDFIAVNCESSLFSSEINPTILVEEQKTNSNFEDLTGDTEVQVDFSLDGGEDILAIEAADLEFSSDSFVVEDDNMSVGECIEPQGPPFMIDISENSENRYESVGDCTEPQGSPIPIEQSQLELKPLSDNLKNICLEENQSPPLIIAQDLESEQEEILFQDLRQQKEVIEWKMVDMIGVEFSIWVYRIYFEENVKSFRKPLRRLKLLMFGNVKKDELEPTRMKNAWIYEIILYKVRHKWIEGLYLPAQDII